MPVGSYGWDSRSRVDHPDVPLYSSFDTTGFWGVPSAKDRRKTSMSQARRGNQRRSLLGRSTKKAASRLADGEDNSSTNTAPPLPHLHSPHPPPQHALRCCPAPARVAASAGRQAEVSAGGAAGSWFDTVGRWDPTRPLGRSVGRVVSNSPSAAPPTPPASFLASRDLITVGSCLPRLRSVTRAQPPPTQGHQEDPCKEDSLRTPCEGESVRAHSPMRWVATPLIPIVTVRTHRTVGFKPCPPSMPRLPSLSQG